MTVYLIGQIKSMCHGHGMFWDEKVATEVDPYGGNHNMHPVFTNREHAEEYIRSLGQFSSEIIIEAELRATELKLMEELKQVTEARRSAMRACVMAHWA